MARMLWIAPEERNFLTCNGLSSLEDFCRLADGTRLDKAGLEGWRQRWRIELPDEHGRMRVLYLKRFERPPAARQWGRWGDGHVWLSWAGVEWHNARLLAEAGIPAVQAVAFGQDMTGPWERRSFVMTRPAAGESLERWLPAHLPPAAKDPDLPARRRMLVDLAVMVGRFHRLGFVHRDLYLSHIFIESGEFRLIDLQRVFRPRWRRGRWLVKDLAALHFSTPADRVGRWERLRFLCRYAREYGRADSARMLAGLIDMKARRMARRRPELAVGL